MGLFLAGPWAERPVWREALTLLPAFALLGVIVPGLRAGDLVLWLATSITVALYWLTGRTLAALLGGFAVLLAAAWATG